MKFLRVVFTLCFLTNVFASKVDINSEAISEIQFNVVKAFDVYDPKTGYSHRIDPYSGKKDLKIRIVGQNGWAYKVKLEINGVEKDVEYQVTKRYLKNALDFATAYNMLRLNQTVQEAGQSPEQECDPGAITPQDLFEEPEVVVTNNNEWKEGCEVLADRSALDQADAGQKAKLGQCIKSIQNSITRRGTVTSRGQLFRNIYRYLKPEEQHFAAMVFTSQGEAGILTPDVNDSSVKHPEELMMIMKVIDNRVRNSNEDAKRRGETGDTTALDVALDPLQFSMYNANETLWSTMMQPGSNQKFDVAIDAYMKFNKANFEPKPDIDHVYHYHANWMVPTGWGSRFSQNKNSLQLQVKVDGGLLRQPNPMYNEDDAADRREIARRWSRQRHIFYRPIDTNGQIVEGQDDWRWTVKKDFRP